MSPTKSGQIVNNRLSSNNRPEVNQSIKPNRDVAYQIDALIFREDWRHGLYVASGKIVFFRVTLILYTGAIVYKVNQFVDSVAADQGKCD